MMPEGRIPPLYSFQKFTLNASKSGTLPDTWSGEPRELSFVELSLCESGEGIVLFEWPTFLAMKNNISCQLFCMWFYMCIYIMLYAANIPLFHIPDPSIQGHMALKACPASMLTPMDLLKSPSSTRYPVHLFMMVSNTRLVCGADRPAQSWRTRAHWSPAYLWLRYLFPVALLALEHGGWSGGWSREAFFFLFFWYSHNWILDIPFPYC